MPHKWFRLRDLGDEAPVSLQDYWLRLWMGKPRQRLIENR